MNNRIIMHGLHVMMLLMLGTVVSEVVAAKNGNGDQENGGGHGFICPEITKISDLKITSKKPTVAVFFTSTCPSCKDIKAPFNDYVTKHKDEVDCVAISANAPGMQAFAQALKIDSVPAVVVIHKHVGFYGASALEQYLNQMTGMSAAANSKNNGGTKMSQPEVVKTKTLEGGKIVPVEEDFEDEDNNYLFPTEKPLVVRPEEIEDLDVEMDMIVSPSSRGSGNISGKMSGDVMP